MALTLAFVSLVREGFKYRIVLSKSGVPHPHLYRAQIDSTKTQSGLIRPLFDKTTGQNRGPFEVLTRLVTLHSLFTVSIYA